MLDVKQCMSISKHQKIKKGWEIQIYAAKPQKFQVLRNIVVEEILLFSRVLNFSIKKRDCSHVFDNYQSY